MKEKGPERLSDTLAEAMKFVHQALAVGTSDAILQQEAQGQQFLIINDVLPSEILPNEAFSGRVILEQAGVVFGSLVEGDTLFQHVELPQGWKKVPTEHSMWSTLLDENGLIRASIFYKAAFYDRRASMSVVNWNDEGTSEPKKK